MSTQALLCKDAETDIQLGNTYEYFNTRLSVSHMHILHIYIHPSITER